MVLFNYGNKEITAKLVYYGPGLCGKTTNLQFIHEKMNPDTRGKLLSLATETDRTLFFDFLPVNLGMIRGFTVRFQLYTVPGQVYYNATRKLVLKGADAVIFVADSQTEMLEKNLESFENMKENLIVNGLDPATIPLVMQYNKRDLPNIMDVDALEQKLNLRNDPSQTAVAVTGEGVLDTFKLVTKELMKSLRTKHNIQELQEVGGGGAKPAAPSGSPPMPAAETPQKTATQKRPAPVKPVPVQPQPAPPAAQAGPAPEELKRVPPPVPVPEACRPDPKETNHLPEAVRELQSQMRNIEAQLNALLSKDTMIEKLLQQIKSKLDVEEQASQVISVEEIEEPNILEDEKPKKKRFFWNR